MITYFWLQGFKSFQEAVLPLSHLTLLIGANASGKSNALEGLRLLSWLARGRRLGEIFQTVQEASLDIRGELLRLPYRDRQDFGLGCSVLGGDGWDNLWIKLQVDENGMRIIEEAVYSDYRNMPLYEVKYLPPDQYSSDLQVAYNNFSRGGRKPLIVCTDQQAVFTQLETPARFSTTGAQNTIPRVVKVFRAALEQILFLDPNPRHMRGYSFIPDRVLQGDGANISSVLYDLCERAHLKEQVLDFIRSLPEQDIRDISFLKGPRGDLMVQLTESFGGLQQTWDAAMLSDGTLRVLAITAALLSAPTGALVVIEEIDNGVHPSRAHMLLENIQRVSKERNLHVLLTSHNPALLDALPDESIPNVVCCYRDPQVGDSRLIRLEDLPEYPELIAQGPLGQLMTRGVLERFLKTRRSEKDRQTEGLAWLDSLESSMEGV